jgi:glucans biosynthesis protein
MTIRVLRLIAAGIGGVVITVAGQTSAPPVATTTSAPPVNAQAATTAPPVVAQASTSAPAAFSYETVRERARAMAAKEFKPDLSPELPEELKKLTYDGYQGIHFRPEESLWPNQRLQFSIQFFQRGYLYKEPVRIHFIEAGQVHDFQFSPQQFDYGKTRFTKPLPSGLHFAGLRVVYHSRNLSRQDEVASFLGASYFRIVGIHQRYGSSARGLAIDTAEPKGEEFPRFTEFWIEKPNQLDAHLQIYALLDSPSVTGAYRFVIKPGEITTADVEASVFLRKEVKKLGLAPVTSMFLVGKNRTRFVPDFRPEVHDSDGLLLQPGPEDWQWRPLVNPPKEHHISTYPVEDLWGFGLMQRERDFREYEDLVSRYHQRASLWTEPKSKWGPGTVELVEIPSTTEFNDNIVTYWIPKQKSAAGQDFRYTYSLSALSEDPGAEPSLRVRSTRINPEHDKNPPRFFVDFSGDLPPYLAAGAPLTAKAQASHGEIRNVVVEKNDVIGGWRAFFDLLNAGSEPVDLRLSLFSGEQSVGETWIYHYQNP